MAETTGIEWCDHTWNPWRGCEHATLPDGSVHEGCLHCYAEEWSKRNPAVFGEWGPGGRRVVGAEAAWRAPYGWNKRAEKTGVRESCFPSLMDPFEDWRRVVVSHRKVVDPACPENGFQETPRAPAMMWWRNDIGVVEAGQTTVGHVRGERPATMGDLRSRLFRTIDECPNVDFILLTKRPQNVRRMWSPVGLLDVPVWDRGGGVSHAETEVLNYRPNVRLLASVSDQASADAMVPALLECRDLVPVLGLSCEPLVGPVDLTQWIHGLHWVIVGGESGADARPCDIAWIRSIRDQCAAEGVPCFVKQLGARPVERYPSAWPNGYPYGEQSVVLTGDGFGTFLVTGLRDKKGGDWDEWPADLRVRQYPQVAG